MSSKFIQTRPPLEYAKPFEKAKYRNYDGIVEPARNYMELFENGPPPERMLEETPKDKKLREWKERLMETKKKAKEEMKKWDPKTNPNATEDPYKTLFVCRINKETNAKHLKKVFEEYGPIKKITMIHDTKSGKFRYYAFIEFENINDFKGILFDN